jgi:hypothetical protein
MGSLTASPAAAQRVGADVADGRTEAERDVEDVIEEAVRKSTDRGLVDAHVLTFKTAKRPGAGLEIRLSDGRCIIVHVRERIN